MDKNPINLDELLAAERENTPELPMRLMEKILADAADISADRSQATKPVDRTNWFRRLLEPFGGVPALVGAMAAMVLGISVGYAGTDSIPLFEDYFASLSADPLGDFGLEIDNFDTILEEG